jgi:hypothetical protein
MLKEEGHAPTTRNLQPHVARLRRAVRDHNREARDHKFRVDLFWGCCDGAGTPGFSLSFYTGTEDDPEKWDDSVHVTCGYRNRIRDMKAAVEELQTFLP